MPMGDFVIGFYIPVTASCVGVSVPPYLHLPGFFLVSDYQSVWLGEFVSYRNPSLNFHEANLAEPIRNFRKYI